MWSLDDGFGFKLCFLVREGAPEKSPDKSHGGSYPKPRNSNRVFPSLDDGLGGVPLEQKMLKGHLPRVMFHRVY